VKRWPSLRSPFSTLPSITTLVICCWRTSSMNCEYGICVCVVRCAPN
jgi:hypothetical protein